MFLSFPSSPPFPRHLCGLHAAERLTLAKRDGEGIEAAGLAAAGAAEEHAAAGAPAAADRGRGEGDDDMVNSTELLALVKPVFLLAGETLRLAAALGASALEGFSVRLRAHPLKERGEEERCRFQKRRASFPASFSDARGPRKNRKRKMFFFNFLNERKESGQRQQGPSSPPLYPAPKSSELLHKTPVKRQCKEK